MSKIPVDETWKNSDGKYVCPQCGQSYTKFGISSHIWRSHTKEGRNHPSGYAIHSKTKGVWNKGLTKDTDKRVEKSADTYKKHLADGTITHSFLGRSHSPETIKKMKDTCGGYRQGSGWGKSGWYKGYWCDSTWELALIIYMLDMGIDFKRNTQKFEYIYKEEKHSYTPDFLLECGVYIEVKGYQTAQTRAKHSQFPYLLKVMTKEDMLSILQYVENKHGSLKELYDNMSG